MIKLSHDSLHKFEASALIHGVIGKKNCTHIFVPNFLHKQVLDKCFEIHQIFFILYNGLASKKKNIFKEPREKNDSVMKWLHFCTFQISIFF